jgi:hypothetical protein
MNIKTNSARDRGTAKCVVLSECVLKLMQLASCPNPTSVESSRRVAENLICVSIWFLVALRNKFSILCFFIAQGMLETQGSVPVGTQCARNVVCKPA